MEDCGRGIALKVQVEPADECDGGSERAGERKIGAKIADSEKLGEFPCRAEGDESAEGGEESGGSAKVLICSEKCDESRDQNAGHQESPAEHGFGSWQMDVEF